MIHPDCKTVVHQGRDLILQQDPYITNSPDDSVDFYEALAEDNIGRQYKVRWEIIAEDPDEAEECDMCHWDVYTITELF